MTTPDRKTPAPKSRRSRAVLALLMSATMTGALLPAQQASAQFKLPRIELPKIKPPKIRLPEIKPPKINLPKVELPRVELPQIGFIRSAKALLKQSSGLVIEVSKGLGRCASGTVTDIIEGVKEGRIEKSAAAAQLSQMRCVQELIVSARRAGYKTLSIGIGGGPSYFIGGDGELGFAFDTAGKRPPVFYATVMVSGGFQMGGTVGLVAGLYRSPNHELGGLAHGVSAGAAAGGGSTAGVWFDLLNGDPIGFSVLLTVGVEGSAAYGMGRTEVSGPLR